MSEDKRLEGFSKQEICAFRLRCVEPFIAHASKYSVEKGEVFVLAERSWEFMLEGLGKKQIEGTSVAHKSSSAQ